MRQVALDRIATASQDDLGVLLENDIRKEAIPRAVELFISAHSWATANSVADKAVLPLAALFSQSDVEQVLEAAGERKADLIGSGGFQRFLDRLRESNGVPAKWLTEKLNTYDLASYIDEQPDTSSTDIEGSQATD